MDEPYLHALLVSAVVLATLFAGLEWRQKPIPPAAFVAVVLSGAAVHAWRFRAIQAPAEDAAIEAVFGLVGAVFVGALPFALYRRGALGGRDVGAFVALGAILQPTLGLEAAAFTFIACALVAPVALAIDGRLRRTMHNAWTLGMNLFRPKEKITPVASSELTALDVGPALVLGTLATALVNW